MACLEVDILKDANHFYGYINPGILSITLLYTSHLGFVREQLYFTNTS